MGTQMHRCVCTLVYFYFLLAPNFSLSQWNHCNSSAIRQDLIIKQGQNLKPFDFKFLQSEHICQLQLKKGELLVTSTLLCLIPKLSKTQRRYTKKKNCTSVRKEVLIMNNTQICIKICLVYRFKRNPECVNKKAPHIYTHRQ